MAFIITQSTSDIQVLKFIQDTLGFGKVRNQSAITSRYVCQAKPEMYSLTLDEKHYHV